MSIAYRRLDSSRREIRLVEIQPARDFNDPIDCRLVNVRLTDDLEYIALSSLYGDPAVTDKIFVNGQPVTITSHLTQALKQIRTVFHPTISQRQLRLPAKRSHGAPRWLRQLLGLTVSSPRAEGEGRPMRLWCDFLCVNPRDEYEKSRQHADMRVIYRSAELVVGWLGEKSEHTDAAAVSLADIDNAMPPTWGDPGDRQKYPDEYSPKHNWTKKITYIWSPGPNGEPANELPAWAGLTDFITRQYFQRRWILEEIAMARYPTFLIGEIIVPWKQVLRLNRLMEEFKSQPSNVFPQEYYAAMADLPLETAHKLLDEYAKREALEEAKILKEQSGSSRATSSSRSNDP